MITLDFSGKTALITGGARGIGRTIALTLGRAGADVAVNYRKPGGTSEKPARALADELAALGRRCVLVPADISVKAEVDRCVSQTLEAFGRLDFLILNAARAPFKEFGRLLERELRSLVDVNLLGNVFMLQRALEPLSLTRGRTVFISSLGSRFYHPEYPLGWVKAAMENVVMSWAQAYADRGVNVNAVCAGLVKTDSFKVLRLLWPEVAMLPESAFVPPQEVADVVAFLCSPLADGIRGQTVVVDRGTGNTLIRGREHLGGPRPQLPEENA